MPAIRESNAPMDDERTARVLALAGDLERLGQRWRLLNPRLTDVISDDEPESGDVYRRLVVGHRTGLDET